MRNLVVRSVGVCVLLSALLISCSSETSPQKQPEAKQPTQDRVEEQAQPAGPSQPPAASTEPVAAAEGASPGARGESPSATEQHRLRVHNRSGVPVTVSLNGEWVGQWEEEYVTVPLDSAVQGRNDLVVEVAGEPTKDVDLWVEAYRSDAWTHLIHANFKDKPGSHTRQFVAR